MRTAYGFEPNTPTCATPGNMDNDCANLLSAYSVTVEIGKVSECNAIKKIGASAGFDFRIEGVEVMFFGSLRCAALIAPCTSNAAPSISRSRLN